MYKDYLVVFESSDGKYKSMGVDKDLIKYIKKGIVSYIVVDKEFSVRIYDSKDNRKEELIIRKFLSKFINDRL